jgi:hypothetical protein
MNADPLQEEIWAVREKIVRECGFDSARISEYFRRVEDRLRREGATLCTNAQAYAAAHPEPPQLPPVDYEPLQPNPILEEIYRIRAEMARKEDPSLQTALVREEPRVTPPGDTAGRP